MSRGDYCISCGGDRGRLDPCSDVFHEDRGWDARFLTLTRHIGMWSKDPSTGVGCVIVRPDRTIASVGYNGFPRGVEDSSARLDDRDTKLAFTVHAEPNAIIAARESLAGYALYCTPFPPCSHCAGLIVQAGIARVVAPAPSDHQLKRWGDSFSIANRIFEEAGVELILRPDFSTTWPPR